eukprot:m.886787 g.886787  ORF g.886787 m.886787 type:complete len:1258 (+) comp59913_c0_seq1:2120-5893(+)
MRLLLSLERAGERGDVGLEGRHLLGVLGVLSVELGLRVLEGGLTLGHCIELGVGGLQRLLELLALLLERSVGLLQAADAGAERARLLGQLGAVRLELGLGTQGGLELLLELLLGLRSLLLQSGQGLLALLLEGLHLVLEVSDLLLALLVDLNLGGGGATSLLQSVLKILELLGQLVALLLDLGARSSLALQVVLELLNLELQLADATLQDTDLLVSLFELPGQLQRLRSLLGQGVGDLLLLAHGLVQRLGRRLESGLHLALGLVQLGSLLALGLQGSLGVGNLGLELGLQAAKVVDLVLRDLQQLGDLLHLVLGRLLLLVQTCGQLGDLGQLLLQVADGVLTLLLLGLQALRVDGLLCNLLAQLVDLNLELSLGGGELSVSLLLLIQALFQLQQLSIELVLLGLEGSSTFLGLGSRIALDLKIGLKAAPGFVELGNLGLEVLASVLLLLQLGLSSRQSLLLLAKILLGAGNVQQGLDASEQLPPRPLAQHKVRAHIALDDLDAHQLVLQAAVAATSQETAAVRLDLRDGRGQLGIARLLQTTKHTGSEEHLGVSDAELGGIELQGLDEHLSSLATVHEARRQLARRQQRVALTELLEQDAVGEALAADANAFNDTVAAQLVQGELGVQSHGLLELVGDDAANKVRIGVQKSLHQVGQLLLVQLANSDELAALLAAISGLAVGPDVRNESVGGTLQQLDHVVVQGVLVLVDPVVHGVRDGAGVVVDLEVADVLVLAVAGLGVVLRAAMVVGVQLLGEGSVCRLGEQALLVQQSQNTHALLDEVDAGLEVEAEVNEVPVDAFLLVLLLLNVEHVVVEELLQALVGVVDEQLLERVELEDLETGNVKHTNEVGARRLGLDGLVDATHKPLEHALVGGLGQRLDGVDNLVKSAALDGVLVAGLDARAQQSLGEVLDAQAQQMRHNLGLLVVQDAVSVLGSLGLAKLDVAKVQDGGDGFEQVQGLLLAEAHHSHGVASGLELEGIVDLVNKERGLGQEGVRGRITVQQESLCKTVAGTSQKLVEDVEAALAGLLAHNARLLQQVGLNVSAGNLALVAELHANELAKARRVVVADGLGIAESLEHGIGLDDLVLDVALGCASVCAGDGGKVLDDLLGALSLACTTLSGDDDHLISSLLHCAVDSIGSGIDVRRHLVKVTAAVVQHLCLRVDWQHLVGVHRHNNVANVRVDFVGHEAFAEVFDEILLCEGIKEDQVPNACCCIVHLCSAGLICTICLGCGVWLLSATADTARVRRSEERAGGRC